MSLEFQEAHLGSQNSHPILSAKGSGYQPHREISKGKGQKTPLPPKSDQSLLRHFLKNSVERNIVVESHRLGYDTWALVEPSPEASCLERNSVS